ncbi:DUF2807 domain-containing protein [Gallaecimonas sp. GXIMD4217]|uniref:GIN domain-containing protein n=1 Tax=Gallaecimonas sp. GXIMD4217 TaxID=3131927 RepID=UPI00311AD068
MTRLLQLCLAALLLGGCASTEDSQGATDRTLAMPAFQKVAIKTAGRVVILPYGKHYLHAVGEPGGLAKLSAEVVDGTLVVGCGEYCTEQLDLEIGTSTLNGLQLVNGGEVVIKPGFLPVHQFSLSLNNGGLVDATALSSRQVVASLFGGGMVRVKAEQQLNANIAQGGTVLYQGSPRVQKSIVGGGKVQAME